MIPKKTDDLIAEIDKIIGEDPISESEEKASPLDPPPNPNRRGQTHQFIQEKVQKAS